MEGMQEAAHKRQGLVITETNLHVRESRGLFHLQAADSPHAL